VEIAIDFDGTCVSHEYPKIGEDIGAVPVLKQLVQKGHHLILYTMRSGKQLDEAVAWFSQNGIKLWAKQYNPTQRNWTSSNKCYAQLYIDDAALGCPLKYDKVRPYVDWVEVNKILKGSGVL
jgi:hypothetical protein